tara:strand:+ start:99 stop:461 length:363 start_codon:yes stop_codon:yes gene_type:complete
MPVDVDKNREYQRRWYQKNKELQIERNNANKQRKLDWYREYKETLQCQQCGENHPATLDFHHRSSEDKDNQVCELVLNNCGMERILAEIEKCDVLCANCHRKLHYSENMGARPNGEAAGL